MAKLGDLNLHGGPTELPSWSVYDRQNFFTRLAERELGDVEAQAKTGAIAVGMTPAQLDRAAAVRPDDRAIQQSQASLISGQLLPAQAGILDQANAALAARPDDPLAIRDAALATQQYSKLAAQLADLHDSLDGLTPGFRDFAAAVRESAEQGLGSLFYDLVTGANSLRQTFASLAQSILKEFLDLQARNLVQGLIGDAGKQQQSGQSGGWGGLVGAIIGGFARGAGGGATTTTTAAANGAVFPGGFQAFAGGGIARHPTLGLIGERMDRVPEAVIPMLGSGGRIPLTMDHRGEIAARLPGGRSVPAVLENAMRRYSDGGVVGEARVPTNISRGVTQLASGEMWAGRNTAHIDRVFGMHGTAMRDLPPQQVPQNIYVVNDVDSAIRAGFRKHKDALISVVSGDIAKGGAVGKAVRR